MKAWEEKDAAEKDMKDTARPRPASKKGMVWNETTGDWLEKNFPPGPVEERLPAAPVVDYAAPRAAPPAPPAERPPMRGRESHRELLRSMDALGTRLGGRRSAR